jgi:hypothetical protein
MSHIWDMVSRRQGRPLKTTGLLGDVAGGFFEEFMDEGLAGLGLLGGHAAAC